MNAYRKLYNQVLDLKFVMLKNAICEEDLLCEEYIRTTAILKELDDLAAEEFYATQTHTEFITGSK